MIIFMVLVTWSWGCPRVYFWITFIKSTLFITVQRRNVWNWKHFGEKWRDLLIFFFSSVLFAQVTQTFCLFYSLTLHFTCGLLILISIGIRYTFSSFGWHDSFVLFCFIISGTNFIRELIFKWILTCNRDT